MKQKLLSLLLLVIAIPAWSQSWEEIKNDRRYLYGEGWGVTVAEADRNALNDLISKISVSVSGKTDQNLSEKVTNQGVESNSTFTQTVATYSQATLNNTEKVVLQNEPDAHVGRWILRTEIDRIFASRMIKIMDYIETALSAERQGKVDIALKSYYWALMLTRSLREPNKMTYRMEDENGKEIEKTVLTWIPGQMNDILTQLKSNVVKRNGDELELLFTYKDKPVNSIDYSYFDGRDWSSVYSAKDGAGVLELPPNSTLEQAQLRYEFEYRGESMIDPELKGVMEVTSAIPVRKAYTNIKLQACNEGAVIKPNTSQVVAESPTASFASVAPAIYKKPEAITPDDCMKSAVDEVVNSVIKKNYDGMESYFTPYAYDIYNRLIRYGKAKLVGTPNIRFYRQGDRVYARGVHMAFSFKGGARKSFVQDIVMLFNKEGKIDNLSFGLGKTAEDDILGKGVWSESARFAIMDFLENYQTAYALKRHDYISRIFDDDAVIITGKVEHRPGKVMTGANGEVKGIAFANDIVRYNRQTKDSYLKQLKLHMDANEFINIKFANNDVVKLGKGGELYAIQISQEYFSSHYGDKGYLFLMVDINNPNEPVIKVRTWQPEKDPNFGVYGPGDFQ